MCVNKKPQSETGNKRLREPHKTRSAKRTSAAEQKREQRVRVRVREQKREQRTHAAPKNSSSLLSSCPPHQLTQLQQTSLLRKEIMNKLVVDLLQQKDLGC